jgi:hypothetical protein
MATTAAKAFDEFHDLITPTPAQKQRVNDRAATGKAYLERFFGPDHEMPVKRVVMMGSAARDTQVRPLTDLDVLAEFSNENGVFEKYRYDSHAFVRRIRDTFDARTQIAWIGVRGQAVRLFYKDDLHVDIAPVFGWSGGGFALPSGDGRWLTTDPFAQQEWSDEKQRQFDGLYRRRVRMLKRWNRVHGRRLSSYHLEVMVGHVFSTMGKDSRDALWRFFQWAPGHLHVSDPAGYGGDLAEELSNTETRAVLHSFRSSEERAGRAVRTELDGDHAEAIRQWGVVLGEEFPTYG